MQPNSEGKETAFMDIPAKDNLKPEHWKFVSVLNIGKIYILN